MQQGSSVTGTAGATATLTDEQILGLDPMPEGGNPASPPSENAVILSGAKDLSSSADAANGDLSNAESPRRRAASAAPETTELSAQKEDPAWLAALESQPQGGREAAAEARAWRAAATDIAGLDAAYFSADPAVRSGLAARLYDSDPAAFRAMLAESARVIAQRDPAALAELARQLGSGPSESRLSNAMRPDRNGLGEHALSSAESPRRRAASAAPETTELSAQREVPAPAAFPAEAYRSFETATNDAVARRVHQQIDHTLGNTLPEGTPEGARRRIAEDIFEEVHASLAADRDLARRVGETLRDWRFDATARAQVSDLLSGRARAVLPEVARRVVAEWTSSVLASDRAKSARIAAATARRDVTGGRLPEPVPASALRPHDVDYRRLSDEQILDL